jgi:SepF-like predicted cell division protein (DUF552 family)
MVSIEKGSSGEFEFHAFPRSSLGAITSDEILIKPFYTNEDNLQHVIKYRNKFQINSYSMSDVSNIMKNILINASPHSINIIIKMTNIQEKWSDVYHMWDELRNGYANTHGDLLEKKSAWVSFITERGFRCNRRIDHTFVNADYSYPDILLDYNTFDKIADYNIWYSVKFDNYEIINWANRLYTIATTKKGDNYETMLAHIHDESAALQGGDHHTSIFLVDGNVVISNEGDIASVIVIERKKL